MKSLVIVGRRWFRRGPGNTYFSAVAMIDGATVATIDYAYGYGNQYEWEMFQKLVREGFIKGVEKLQHNMESPWRWCERNGVTYNSSVTDVHRKKDL